MLGKVCKAIPAAQRERFGIMSRIWEHGEDSGNGSITFQHLEVT